MFACMCLENDWEISGSNARGCSWALEMGSFSFLNLVFVLSSQ